MTDFGENRRPTQTDLVSKSVLQRFKNIRDGQQATGNESTSDNKSVLLAPTEKEIELSTLPIDAKGSRQLDGGTNRVEFVNITGDGSGVFKPGRGEENLGEFYESEFRAARGKLYRRERGAYLVNRAFRMGLVPATVIRTIDGYEGSLQEFIPNARSLWEVSDQGSLENKLYAMSLLDYFIWNKDRKPANILVTEAANRYRLSPKMPDELYLIDHGLSFEPWEESRFFSPYRSENLRRYVSGRPMPRDLMDNMQLFHEDSNLQANLGTELTKLLSTQDITVSKPIDAFFARVSQVYEKVSRNGKIFMHDLTDRNDELIYHPRR